MFMRRFNALFPLWAVLLSAVAFFADRQFAALEGAIVPLLALVMFMMGLTLTRADLARITRKPVPVFIGVLLQFLFMPLAAFMLADMLRLSPQLTAGLVLVGCCSGGTASNVIAWLARGDVALSISMTLASSLIGVVATPLLVSFYLSQSVEVNTLGLLLSILQMVLLPVLLGGICNHFVPGLIRHIEFVLPSLAIIAILLIIAIVVALNADSLLQVGLLAAVAVVLHNLLGLSGGYWCSRLLGLDEKQSRTIAIEVGMQNSGLGVALALQFFSATAALPGALFSVWHNITGSVLASKWGK